MTTGPRIQDAPFDGGSDDVIRDLHSPVAKVAREARERLAALGVAAVPTLTRLLDDPAPGARWEAAQALAQLRDPAAAPGLVAALTDDDGGVRWIAAAGLIRLGPACLVPLLRELLARSESVWLRDGVHHVLTGLMHKGKLPAAVWPVLPAIEGINPAIGVLEPAFEALTALEGPVS